MPGASVKVGPVRVGSGCCVALVVPALIVVMTFFALGGTAFAAKQYVLKHPKREHCKTHYVKKTKTIRKHGHKIKEIVCQYVAPKSTTKTEPQTTTTTLAATLEKECKPVEGGHNTFGLCTYTVIYSTVNNKGEAVPGETIIKEHVPPSQEERKVAIPSGAIVSIGWEASNSSLSTECWLNSVINKVEQPKYGCEKQNPREILIAEYIPAPGYLASHSEPATLQ